MSNPSAPALSLPEWDRRFAQAMASLPERRPWVEAEREAILATAARCLRVREAWVPTLRPEAVATTQCEGYRVEHLCFTSWPGCHGAAHLYLPDGGETTPPLVVIGCGHGGGGKQNPGYSALAARLARNGVAALVSDNIGQGEREPMGHRHVPGVFAAGLSLQGLIVMETIGWLRWVGQSARFDLRRLGFAGNSGGGTLSLFVSAFCRDQLAAASSSGYPSTFEFIARKEKVHCHCNVLPDIVGELEMWHLFGTLAPLPLFLFQGNGDPLFPQDLFWRTVARVQDAYTEAGMPDRLRAQVFSGGHSWDAARREALAAFFCETFGLPFENAPEPPPETAPGPCLAGWPAEALTAEALAERLTGCPAHAAPPPASGAKNRFLRGDPAQIAAQFAVFLKKTTS